MRNKLVWADVDYSLEFKDGSVDKFMKESCFGDLFEMCFSDYKRIHKITVYRINYKETYPYRDNYLELLEDAFSIKNMKVMEDSVSFTPDPVRIKTLIVLTFIRFLFEDFGNTFGKIPLHNQFFHKLFKNKSIFHIKSYNDSLEKICFFYKRIEIKEKYFRNVHGPKPSNVRIKNKKQFDELTNKDKEVNEFFINK